MADSTTTAASCGGAPPRVTRSAPRSAAASAASACIASAASAIGDAVESASATDSATGGAAEVSSVSVSTTRRRRRRVPDWTSPIAASAAASMSCRPLRRPRSSIVRTRAMCSSGRAVMWLRTGTSNSRRRWTSASGERFSSLATSYTRMRPDFPPKIQCCESDIPAISSAARLANPASVIPIAEAGPRPIACPSSSRENAV